MVLLDQPPSSVVPLTEHAAGSLHAVSHQPSARSAASSNPSHPPPSSSRIPLPASVQTMSALLQAAATSPLLNAPVHQNDLFGPLPPPLRRPALSPLREESSQPTSLTDKEASGPSGTPADGDAPPQPAATPDSSPTSPKTAALDVASKAVDNGIVTDDVAAPEEKLNEGENIEPAPASKSVALPHSTTPVPLYLGRTCSASAAPAASKPKRKAVTPDYGDTESEEEVERASPVKKGKPVPPTLASNRERRECTTSKRVNAIALNNQEDADAHDAAGSLRGAANKRRKLG